MKECDGIWHKFLRNDFTPYLCSSYCWSTPSAVRRLSFFAFSVLLYSSVVCAQENPLGDTARVVVAIRYFQVSGTSHSHLYLYNGTGKLLRQLTDSAEGQDRDPVFSPDGNSIAFRRESQARNELWSVSTDGRKAAHLSTTPTWYFSALKTPMRIFDTPPFVSLPSDAQEQRIKDYVTPDEIRYPSPNDDRTAIVLKPQGEAEPEHDYFNKEPWLVEKDKPDVLISKLPFVAFAASSSEEEKKMRKSERDNQYETGTEAGALDGVMVYQGSPFIWNPPLRVAFLRQHRGSTFGEGYFALDLNTRTLHEIVPSGGDIYKLPPLQGFFCVNDERYLPLGDGKRTVNCSFLDLWNAQLQRTRFCQPKVAEFYGGCLHWEKQNVFLPGEPESP